MVPFQCLMSSPTISAYTYQSFDFVEFVLVYSLSCYNSLSSFNKRVFSIHYVLISNIALSILIQLTIQ